MTLPDTENVVRREERLWSIPAMLCFLARGDAALHAAAVEVDGQAVVLAAPGSFGKTTLAAAFHAAGHRLLSEDTTCIRGAEAPLVVPGPAMLRLRHDVAEQLEIPNATPVGTVEDDRVHLALDPAVRGDCSPVPLRAIVLLRHADEGFRIEPASRRRRPSGISGRSASGCPPMPTGRAASSRWSTSRDRSRCGTSTGR